MIRPFFLLLTTTLVLSGCPRPPPLDFGTRGRIDDPSVALEAVQSRAANFTSVRGEAKAKVDTPDGGGSLTQFVLAERPDRVRLESIDFFGRPVAVLASDGGVGRLYDVERNVLYEGPATAQMVSRLLPLQVEPEHLLSLLLGQPPVLEDALPARLEVDDQARTYVLTLSRGGDVQTIGLDPATLRPLWVRMPERGLLAGWTARFADYDDETELPKRVTLVSEDGLSKVELSWREREVNPEIDPEVFVLEVPESAEVRPL